MMEQHLLNCASSLFFPSVTGQMSGDTSIDTQRVFLHPCMSNCRGGKEACASSSTMTDIYKKQNQKNI